MNTNAWLQDRRWRWRVVVLAILLIAIGALIWRGYDPLAAAGAASMIFVLAAHVIGLIIDERQPARPIADHPAVAAEQLGPAARPDRVSAARRQAPSAESSTHGKDLTTGEMTT